MTHWPLSSPPLPAIQGAPEPAMEMDKVTMDLLSLGSRRLCWMGSVDLEKSGFHGDFMI